MKQNSDFTLQGTRGKKEQNEASKVSSRKEERSEWKQNETENKITRMNKTKSWFLKR